MIRQSGFQIVTVNDVFFLQLITDLDNKHQNISIITREKCSVMHPEDIQYMAMTDREKSQLG
jgi:hypothetical protein